MEIQKEVRRGHVASPKSMKRFRKVWSKAPRTINTGEPPCANPQLICTEIQRIY